MGRTPATAWMRRLVADHLNGYGTRMASLGDISIPVKVKGIKPLVRVVASLVELVTDFRLEMRTLVSEAVNSLNESLGNIEGDLTRLADAASTKADADAATIAQLRSDVQAAADQKGLDDATITQLNQAVSDAEASLANAQQTFDAELQPTVDRAKAIAARNPEPEAPADPGTPPGEPADPGTPPADPDTPPVDDTPAPPVEEPAPPVDNGDVPPAPPQV